MSLQSVVESTDCGLGCAERRDCLHPWNYTQWLLQGVLFRPASPQLSLCTDASTVGWGILIPPMGMRAGFWTNSVRNRHVNKLEILAVFRAVTLWRTLLTGQSVFSFISQHSGIRLPKTSGSHEVSCFLSTHLRSTPVDSLTTDLTNPMTLFQVV